LKNSKKRLKCNIRNKILRQSVIGLEYTPTKTSVVRKSIMAGTILQLRKSINESNKQKTNNKWINCKLQYYAINKIIKEIKEK